jgi:hypothetical protein
VSDEPQEYELVLPFVACRSKGGPHEDEPFVAGFECGSIDARLAYERPDRLNVTVRRDSLAQLDLIAMHRGYRMHDVYIVRPGDEEWTVVTFSRIGDTS